jgi:hypothetical protein
VLTLPDSHDIVITDAEGTTGGGRKGVDCLFFVTKGGLYTLPSHNRELASSSPTTMKNAAAKTGEHYPVRTHASGRLATNAASSIVPPV